MDEKDKQIEDLKKQLDAAVSAGTLKDQAVIDLKKQLETGKTDAAKKDQDLADAVQVIADLKKKLEEKQAGVIELPTVKVGSDLYELAEGDFTYKGKEVTIDVLKEDAALAKELIKEGISHLRKVEKKA